MEDWGKIDAVDRMQKYILSHLGEKISLRELSKAAGYSPWHSLRIFREFTSHTPFEFIRAARLTEAAKMLRDGSNSVLHTALEVGFDSHDGFTRAFSRRFSLTPQRYRTEKPPVCYFTYYPIRNYYLHIKQMEEDGIKMNLPKTSATVTAAERPSRNLIILRSKAATDYFSFCEEVGCDWEGMLNSIPEKLDNAALITLPNHLVCAGTSATAAGVEVPLAYAKPLPAPYEMIALPPCVLLYFEGLPLENEEAFCQAIDTVSAAIQSYNPMRYGYQFDDTVAPRFNFGISAEGGAKLAVPARHM